MARGFSRVARAVTARMSQPLVDFLYRNRENRFIRRARRIGAKWLGDPTQGIEIVRGPLAGSRFAFSDSVAMWIGGHETEVATTILRVLHPGMVAFDIGAHVGYTVLLMARRVGPEGRVIGFEPDPANFELLEKNILMNDLGSYVEAKMLALGVSKGSGDLKRGHLSILTKVEQSGDGSVEISTLDSEVLEGRVPVPDLIVIDAEGAEEDVFRGGWKTLEDHGPMILCEDHYRRDELIAVLSELGYRGEEIDVDHMLYTKPRH